MLYLFRKFQREGNRKGKIVMQRYIIQIFIQEIWKGEWGGFLWTFGGQGQRQEFFEVLEVIEGLEGVGVQRDQNEAIDNEGQFSFEVGYDEFLLKEKLFEFSYIRRGLGFFNWSLRFRYQVCYSIREGSYRQVYKGVVCLLFIGCYRFSWFRSLS